MKTVNFALPVIGLNGDPIIVENEKVLLLNEVVGNFISQGKPDDDPVRQMRMAQTIYESTGEIELEDADFNMVKGAMKQSGATVLVSAMVKSIFDEAEKRK